MAAANLIKSSDGRGFSDASENDPSETGILSGLVWWPYDSQEPQSGIRLMARSVRTSDSPSSGLRMNNRKCLTYGIQGLRMGRERTRFLVGMDQVISSLNDRLALKDLGFIVGLKKTCESRDPVACNLQTPSSWFADHCRTWMRMASSPASSILRPSPSNWRTSRPTTAPAASLFAATGLANGWGSRSG